MIPEDELHKALKNKPLDKVLKDYDLTLSELFQLQRNRKYHTRESNHMVETKSGSYSITKTIDGVSYHYGTYRDKKEAEKIVEALQEKGWDINELPGILKELDIQSKTEKAGKRK